MKMQNQWLFETPPTTQQGQSNFERNFNSVNWETSSDWLFESPLPSTPAYTQCDFIDPRIDVDAQYALFEMLKGDIPTRTAAISLFSAVKNGSLGGIYKENQQVPAKRAQRIGQTWWTLIPSGQSAICITQPPSEPPIIVFKRSLTNRLLLGQALRTVWSTCRLSNPPTYPASGKPCLNRPPKDPCNPNILYARTDACREKWRTCLQTTWCPDPECKYPSKCGLNTECRSACYNSSAICEDDAYFLSRCPKPSVPSTGGA